MFSIDINLVMCFAAAWLIELILGAPGFLPKPSKIISCAARFLADAALGLTGRFTKRDDKKSRSRAGAFLLAYLMGFAFIITAVLVDFTRRLHPVLYYIVNIILLSWAINTRDAVDSALSARKLLENNKDRPEAARDGGAELNRVIANISKKCLDDVVAPILIISAGILLGLPAVVAVTYKALSVLAEETRQNGAVDGSLERAVSRVHYFVLFLPARICGVMLPLLAPFSGSGAAGVSRGFSVTRGVLTVRANSNNANLNDAWAEAAFAGIIGISPEYSNGSAGGEIQKAIMLTAAASFAALACCCGLLLFFGL